MGIEVQWGAAKFPLSFDRKPYAASSHPYGYEPEVISVFEHFLEPGDCAIDAGASIGFHTCVMSKLVGETGLVLAFEPHRESFRYLMHHVHVANQLNNVMCLPVALWKCDEPDLRLFSLDAIGYSSIHPYLDATSCEKIEGASLDGMISEREHPRLIKIDCEGTEPEVLLGAEKALRKGVDCVILELNYFLFEKTGRTDTEIRRYMADLGYEMFLISLTGEMTNTNGFFSNPLQVPPNIRLELRGGHHINVMFSTEEKVRKRWPKIDHIWDL